MQGSAPGHPRFAGCRGTDVLLKRAARTVNASAAFAPVRNSLGRDSGVEEWVTVLASRSCLARGPHRASSTRVSAPDSRPGKAYILKSVYIWQLPAMPHWAMAGAWHNRDTALRLNPPVQVTTVIHGRAVIGAANWSMNRNTASQLLGWYGTGTHKWSAELLCSVSKRHLSSSRFQVLLSRTGCGADQACLVYALP
jgi:hypothetical protein